MILNSMNMLTPPTFLDFEASSLSPDSYPIEVAWSNEDDSIECYLIQPKSEWTDWDEYAEHEIHGIRREQLFDEGIPVESVISKMSEKLANKIVHVDGFFFDIFWCQRLFSSNGYLERIPFELKPFENLLSTYFKHSSRSLSEEIGSVEEQLRIIYPTKHRAADDIRFLKAVFQEIQNRVNSTTNSNHF